MKKVAFFVDGNYLFNQLKYFESFILNGRNLFEYCTRHIRFDEEMYRIFYYDAPPLDRSGKNPLGVDVDFSTTRSAQKMRQHLEELRQTPFVALRLGRVSWCNDWALKPASFYDLLKGKKQFASLTDSDFRPNIRQKAVDMKFGLDIAKLSYKKLVERIVIIAGDSDFAPAAKLARTEGLHVTLDTFGAKPPADLLKHVDWVESQIDTTKDITRHKNNFVNNIKTL